MARRNDHSREELHRMSLEAAEAILESEGAGALSMRRVAQAIGYTHGTLYLIFSNLDGLLLEISGRTLDRLTAELEAAAARHPPGRAQLTAICLAYLTFARRHAARWRLVFEHRLPGGERTPAWLSEKTVRGFGLVEANLRAAGLNESPAALAELTAALWAAVHGITVLTLDDKLVDPSGAPLEPERILERTVETFL